MKPHHKAWLDSHPEYDLAWFVQAVEAGFDVHHIDGDSTNDDPDNLILVEHSDHMKIHGRDPLWQPRRRGDEYMTLSQRAYEMKISDRSMTWKRISEQLGVNQAVAYAKWWATANDLEWPLVLSGKNGKKRPELRA